jgi:SAM-dependent methyltransferase
MSRDTSLDWKNIGATEPWYGVLSTEKFLKANLTALAIEAFYEQGVREIHEVVEIIKRHFGEFKPSVGLDFGCGLGRLAFAMVPYCERVIGLDISPGMLAEGEKQRIARGVANVQLQHELPEGLLVDWINSYIVFQHITPKVGISLIENLLRRLNLGGFISLQLTSRERLQVECVRAVLAATESKLAEDLTQAARTESELRATRRDLGATQAALAEQQLRSSALAQDLAQTLADKSAALDEAARLSTALAEQLAIARDLRRERADADKERQTETRKSAVLERREQEIAALLNSTSWRLSGPWRAYRRQLSRLRRLLHGKKTNRLFDRAWYLRQYRDVTESEIDAYDHYLRYGVGEGRNPNPLFDTIWYLQKMSHVADK